MENLSGVGKQRRFKVRVSSVTSYLARVNLVSHLRATMSLLVLPEPFKAEDFLYLDEYGLDRAGKKYPRQGDLPVFQ